MTESSDVNIQKEALQNTETVECVSNEFSNSIEKRK